MHVCMISGIVKFHVFGDTSSPMEQYHKMVDEAKTFISACYNMSGCKSLNEARVKVWRNRIKRKFLSPQSSVLFRRRIQLSERMHYVVTWQWLSCSAASTPTPPPLILTHCNMGITTPRTELFFSQLLCQQTLP